MLGAWGAGSRPASIISYPYAGLCRMLAASFRESDFGERGQEEGGPELLPCAPVPPRFSAYRYAVTPGFVAALDVAAAAPLAHALAPVHLDAVGQQLRASVGLQLPEAQPLELTCLRLLHVDLTPSRRFS